MAAVFQIVKNSWDALNSAGQYIGLFLVAFIFLFIVENNKNKQLFSYCLLALILVLNPFTANNLLSFYFKAEEYWYVFLLLPVIPICAYCCTEAVMLQEKKKEKIIVFLALVLIALIGGRAMNGDDGLARNDNRAYIADEYLQLFMEMDIEGEPIVLLADDSIMESARAYSQNIGLPYEVTLMNQPADVVEQFYSADLILVHSQMQAPLNCLGNITAVARTYRCNYLILPLEADERWAMEEGGYEVLAQTEQYVLYHDTGEK
ncbi:MAG: hypothetical protein HDR00_01720 [Lachnospiraceae bacterium]|nr:hypothetical protein [Lachnospiraceae bacterium]